MEPTTTDTVRECMRRALAIVAASFYGDTDAMAELALTAIEECDVRELAVLLKAVADIGVWVATADLDLSPTQRLEGLALGLAQ